MTVSTITSASHRMSRYGNSTFDRGGAQVRAYCRHQATVIAVQGEIDVGNVDLVAEYVRRFVIATNRVVVDLSNVNSFAAQGLSLLHTLDEACGDAGIEWFLVASRAVIDRLGVHDDEAMFPITRSVHEALHEIADEIFRRRQALLPLVAKSA